VKANLAMLDFGKIMEKYSMDNFYDEMIEPGGQVRPCYEHLNNRMSGLGFEEVVGRQHAADRAFVSMGITFNVYRDGEGLEKIFPFDIIPRIIPVGEWDQIERGLKQRIIALNFFLQDIYGVQKIIKDGVIPADIVFSSVGYLKQCEGLKPAHNTWAHISGIDLI
jgi:uncharacterized circularly permuted ATP-grasp superfamily protein